MTEQRTDWPKLLISCKNNVIEKVNPFLKMLKKPQPDLGIGAGGDPVKQVDLAAETAIISTLAAFGISFTLISEESGEKTCGRKPSECFITTDPIDGTTNLMRGINFYATSIAVSRTRTPDGVFAALVTDLFHGTTYSAQKDIGAYRDSKRIEPSQNASLGDAVIGLDLNSYKIERIAPRLTSLIGKTKHIRHLGANALELCYVADGTIDAFVDIRGKLRATDIAAAWLIVKEAGAFMTATDGQPLSFELSPKQKVEFVASANEAMHRKILSLIKPEKDKE